MKIPGWDKLDDEQKALVRWQYRLCGDFETALWKAITLADEANLKLLSSGFPVEVSAYRKYRERPGYWGASVRLAGGDVEAGY